MIFFALMLVDVGFLKAHLSIGLVPSTQAPYLGLRSEKVKVHWSLHALIEDFIFSERGDLGDAHGKNAK